MKIALLGATGMLGSKTADCLRAAGHDLLTPTRLDADLTKPYSLERFFEENPFDVLVNCAAFTRVDLCEEPSQFSTALSLNGTAAGWLAKFCRRTGRKLVSYSTDYVFDGEKDGPYSETDRPRPLNHYGTTKWQGERLIAAEAPFHYLIRTSWLFGPHGTHFVKTMAELFKRKKRVEVVNDQTGGPTYTGDVALFTLFLLEKGADPGTYHFANGGSSTWFGFAKEVQKKTGAMDCEVVPVSSESVFRLARRPANSRFDLTKAEKAWGRAPRPWTEALEHYLAKEFEHEPA